jgi:hypothetical protein
MYLLSKFTLAQIVLYNPNKYWIKERSILLIIFKFFQQKKNCNICFRIYYYLISGLWCIHINRLTKGKSIRERCRSKQNCKRIQPHRWNQKNPRKCMSINSFMCRHNSISNKRFSCFSRWTKLQCPYRKTWWIGFIYSWS